MGNILKVTGVDAWRRGWVAISLRDGVFQSATESATIVSLLQMVTDSEYVAIDIPIGLPEGPDPRPADLAAKKLLGSRASSVFLTVPRDVLLAPTLKEANKISKQLTGKGVSAQAYALRDRIFEVEAVEDNPRVIEVHPEVSFRTMAGRPLGPKKSWTGQTLRREVLEGHGIVLPNHLEGIGAVPPDDVLDAAAAAWSAYRFSTRRALSLPPGRSTSNPLERSVIWY